jgi:hypothetical protein
VRGSCLRAAARPPNAAASEAPSQLAKPLGGGNFQLAQIVGSGGEGCAWIQWHASAAYPQPPAFVRAKSQISRESRSFSVYR